MGRVNVILLLGMSLSAWSHCNFDEIQATAVVREVHFEGEVI
jgi:hypothetical protein